MSWMKVKKLHPNAQLPHRAHDTDAGLDVFTIENGVVHAGKDAVIKTGISIAIPDGWVTVVKEKSGRATKNKITVGACVIDSGYRGELLIHLFNNDLMVPWTYGIGEKIAQLVVVPCWTGQPEEVDSLDDTARGEGRMGSTGDRLAEVSPERRIKEFYLPPDECDACHEEGEYGHMENSRNENLTTWEKIHGEPIVDRNGNHQYPPSDKLNELDERTKGLINLGGHLSIGEPEIGKMLPIDGALERGELNMIVTPRVKAKFDEWSSNDAEPQCKYTGIDLKDCTCGDCPYIEGVSPKRKLETRDDW